MGLHEKHSPTGNRTLVSRVTGGDTHHYTIEDCKLISRKSSEHIIRTYIKKNLYVAEGGFDPPTSGLWAQHASSAPLC